MDREAASTESKDEDSEDEAESQDVTSAYNERVGLLIEILLFFTSGIGASLCYIATLSSLVFFEGCYGPNSYVFLNLATFFPLVPVALAQARYDQEYDMKIGSFRTFYFRGLAGFLVSAVFVALIPSTSNIEELLVCTTFLGVSGAVLQGTLNQMASFVSDDPRLKASVSAGLQSSALLTLIISLLSGFGSSENTSGMFSFFYTIAGLQCASFGSFLLLIYNSRKVSDAMTRRDSSLSVALMEMDGGEEMHNYPVEMEYGQIWEKTSLCCITLMFTLVPSFLVGSWFTHINSENMMLPQILFYTRIISDLFGRLVTIKVRPSSTRFLFFLSLIRLLVVLAFFINASTNWFPQRDIVSTILVALISFTSGYLVTGCFQLGPSMLPPEQLERSVTKQASLLNVAFSISAVIGISSSLVLASIGL